MNASFTSWNRALLACMFLHFGQLDTLAGDVDYQSVKSDIELYAKADDLMDERLLLARSRIRGLPATAVTHLVRLFTKNKEDNYREALVDALEHNRASYDISIPFILKQLQGSPNEWKGKIWITRSMDFLWKVDQENAALIARKAVESKDDFIRSKALKLLELSTKNGEQENDAGLSTQPLPSPLKPVAKTAPDLKPTVLTPSEELASSAPWSIIVVFIVAAMGLLWLLLKRRT